MINTSTRYFVKPSGSFNGIVTVPGDKSISHRAIILSSIANGQTTIRGFLPGKDNLATLAALRALGIAIKQHSLTHILVEGRGYHGLCQSPQILDMGNSGTAMRILAGLLCAQSFPSTLVGDASLSQRPMQRILTPLCLMGADIASGPDGRPPLTITPVPHLKGLKYRLPMASAQVKSALILAGLYARGKTIISSPGGIRDHTERMLSWFENPVTETNQGTLVNQQPLVAKDIDVPGDISSAAFFMVGAAITPNSDISLLNIGLNPTRTGIIDILRAMGADITISNCHSRNEEMRGDIYIRYAPLHGITIPKAWVPLAIDEFPAIFIAAACAKGDTYVNNAEELAVKESNRLVAMAKGLQKLGINAEASSGTMHIEGGELQGGEVDSYGDHRIAMAFSIAGLRAKQAITITDCANVATSFPDFLEKAQALGLRICAYEA